MPGFVPSGLAFWMTTLTFPIESNYFFPAKTTSTSLLAPINLLVSHSINKNPHLIHLKASFCFSKYIPFCLFQRLHLVSSLIIKCCLHKILSLQVLFSLSWTFQRTTFKVANLIGLFRCFFFVKSCWRLVCLCGPLVPHHYRRRPSLSVSLHGQTHSLTG